MLSETTLLSDGFVLLWTKADSVLHTHPLDNYSSEWIIVDLFPNQVDMDSFDE